MTLEKKKQPYITQQKRIDCTTVEFSQTASARPINVSSFLLTRVYQRVGHYQMQQKRNLL